MHQGSARVRVLKSAASSKFIVAAAVIAATAAGLHTFPQSSVLAALPPHHLQAAHLGASPANPLGISGERLSSLDPITPPVIPRQTHRTYATVEELPAAGVVTLFRVNEPHDARVPAQSLAARVKRKPGETQQAYLSFVKPQPVVTTQVVARLGRMKPEADWPPTRRNTWLPSSVVLAYAPAASSIESAFDAVMGGLRHRRRFRRSHVHAAAAARPGAAARLARRARARPVRPRPACLGEEPPAGQRARR